MKYRNLTFREKREFHPLHILPTFSQKRANRALTTRRHIRSTPLAKPQHIYSKAKRMITDLSNSSRNPPSTPSWRGEALRPEISILLLTTVPRRFSGTQFTGVCSTSVCYLRPWLAPAQGKCISQPVRATACFVYREGVKQGGEAEGGGAQRRSEAAWPERKRRCATVLCDRMAFWGSSIRRRGIAFYLRDAAANQVTPTFPRGAWPRVTTRCVTRWQLSCVPQAVT